MRQKVEQRVVFDIIKLVDYSSKIVSSWFHVSSQESTQCQEQNPHSLIVNGLEVDFIPKQSISFKIKYAALLQLCVATVH